jgi:hypothetical protein
MQPINYIFFYITAYILCCYFYIIPNLQHWSIATYDLYFDLHPAYILHSKSIVAGGVFSHFLTKDVIEEKGSNSCSDGR